MITHDPYGDGRQISLLGMGCMRLPQTSDHKIDEPLATKMIHDAIDAGVNYLDVAWPYHNGEAEPFVGRVLSDGYRERVNLATKLPCWLLKSEDDVAYYFEKQLERLQTDHIDFYLLHTLNHKTWPKCIQFNVLPYLVEQQKKGRIGKIGFSYHDDYKYFEEIVDYFAWDFVQLQLNYMDKDWQAGHRGADYVTSRNIPLLAMEPLKGGKLTTNIPPAVQDIMDTQAPVERTSAQWAFKWVAAREGMLTILSGMSSPEQVTQNIESFSNKDLATPLTEAEEAFLNKLADTYNEQIKYGCTACGYCMPCPVKIDIPQMITQLNNYYVYGKPDSVLRSVRNNHAFGQASPQDCINCNQCVKICPQGLPVSTIMSEFSALLDQ